MALTPSAMLALDTPLPREALLQGLLPVSGPPLQHALRPGRPLLVLFLCPHCPFVKHVEAEIGRLQADWGERAAILAICSNSITTHPQDGPEGMAAQARCNGWRFPYLHDPSQSVARAFQAACTPDPFLFDAEGRLAYRGQLDPSRPGNGLPCDGRDVRAAMAALLEGSRPSAEQTPSIGCNIKWHPATGAAPAGDGA
ncbi:thioredoxin family protein [Cyanobium sp. FGCU-6]|nr:thioredoxin family protein [Cyanobium sp. FGCU6]